MNRLLSAVEGRTLVLLGRFVPESARDQPEDKRRAQLFVAFSLLGMVFGFLFALFYSFIHHPWGAMIVFVCTGVLAGAPWIVWAYGLEKAGNIYALSLVLGFSGLTSIEGGLHGHAVAWLAVVPLCACILVGQQTCRLWCGICLAVMAVFCALELCGVRMPILYDARWEGAVTAAGYLTLTMFMSAVGILFEVSRRHALAKLHGALDALSEANDLLKQLDQERREFLAIAAHDLRNPLNTMLGFAQLMQMLGSDDPTKQRDSLKRIIAAGGRMRDLLNQLLNMQTIEEGKMAFKLETCDMGALAARAVESHRMAASAKSIFLGFVAPEKNRWATADEQAVLQILDNLISNAIKFSPSNLAIDVRVEETSDGRVCLEVQDAGPGISEEDQQKLYGRFARLSARPTAGESSNGLGLSIVKRLAEAMDGQLNCRSKLGEGSTFILTLKAATPPLAKPPAVRTEPASVEASAVF